MNRFGIFFIVCFSLSGCAGTLQTREPGSIKNVAVVNSFPEQFNYIEIGTTILGYEYQDVDSSHYLKLLITDLLVSHLKNGGYQVTVLEGKENIKNPNYDLVIDIYPSNSYEMEDTMGYGVYSRSLFGKQTQLKTYVFLGLAPRIDGTRYSGVDSGGGIRGESTTDLEGLIEYKQTWSELAKDDQEIIINKLKENINDSMQQAIPSLGI